MLIWLAWRNILRNWRHSVATMLAIAAGFIAVGLFDGFISELEWLMYDGFVNAGMVGQVFIEKKGSRGVLNEDPWVFALDKNEQAFIEDFLHHDPDFVQRVRFLYVNGLVSSGNTNAIFISSAHDVKEGIELRGEKWAWNTIAGVPMDPADGASITTLSKGLAQLLSCTVPQGYYKKDDGGYIKEQREFKCPKTTVQISATTEHSQVNAVDPKVVGIIDVELRDLDNRFLSMPLDLAQQLLDTDKITRVQVKLKSDEVAPGFRARFLKAAASHNLNLDIHPWEEHPEAASVIGGFEILHVFRNLFLTIVAAIGVLAVANTMMKSVHERIQEIGTFRSFGFRQNDIIKLFGFEGLFLGFLSCCAGLVGTIILAFLISKSGITFKGGVSSTPILLKVKFVPLAWLASTILLSLLAMLTSAGAARRASRMVVADALRHVA